MFDELIDRRGWLLADGATGTNLFKAGLETGYPPELWSVERPHEIVGLHRSFIDAGSNIILTNSFGGTAFRLKLHDAQDRVEELNIAAAKLARRAVDEAGDMADGRVLVAGSIGPTGELFEPMGALTMESAREAFAAQAQALAAGGVDLLWVETMSSLDETKAAVEAAAATGLTVASCMTFDTNARSMMGVKPGEFATSDAVAGASWIGANCGIGPAELMHSVCEILAEDSVGKPVIAKGNCGIPAYVEGAIHYHGTPELMARYAVLARDAGARIIGGCCGTSPEHVAAMARALDETPKRDFNAGRAEAALGKAWKDMKVDARAGGDGDGGDDAGRARRGRARRRTKD